MLAKAKKAAHVSNKAVVLLPDSESDDDLRFLQVHSLRQLCVDHIKYSLTVETVLAYAVTAHSMSDTSLLDACLTFIKKPDNR